LKDGYVSHKSIEVALKINHTNATSLPISTKNKKTPLLAFIVTIIELFKHYKLFDLRASNDASQQSAAIGNKIAIAVLKETLPYFKVR